MADNNKKKRGLGRGLNALMTPEPAKAAKPEAEEKPEREVSIRLIDPDPNQPRRSFEAEALEELTESIREHGIIQPLLVRKEGERFVIIAGERRWRAAKAAGLKKVPIILREYTKEAGLEVSLIENIQREDLNPMEEARAFSRLQKEFGLKQEEVAKKVGKSRSAITNALRLLNLDEEVQSMIASGELSTGHAKVLSGVSGKEKQRLLAQRCVAGDWSVRILEKAVKALKEAKSPAKEEKQAKRGEKLIYDRVGREMQEILGTKVAIKHKEDKGKIEISYYSLEELERLMNLIRSLG